MDSNGQSPDMRYKFEKNQDFPLAISSNSSKHNSKVLESLKENYKSQIMMQTSGGSSTRQFEEFLDNQREDRSKYVETTNDREISPDSMIKSFSQLVQ